MVATVLHFLPISLASRLPALLPNPVSSRSLFHDPGPVPSHHSWALGAISRSWYPIQANSSTRRLYLKKRAPSSGKWKSKQSPYTSKARRSPSQSTTHGQAMHFPAQHWILACHSSLLRPTSRTEYTGPSV